MSLLVNQNLERKLVKVEVAALTEHGVTSLMDCSRPCRRFDGVGSLHFSRDFSTQSMMASPFLDNKVKM